MACDSRSHPSHSGTGILPVCFERSHSVGPETHETREPAHFTGSPKAERLASRLQPAGRRCAVDCEMFQSNSCRQHPAGWQVHGVRQKPCRTQLVGNLRYSRARPRHYPPNPKSLDFICAITL